MTTAGDTTADSGAPSLGVAGIDLTGERVVVTGAGGQLGGYLVPALRAAGAFVVGVGHHEGPGIDGTLDITDAGAVARTIAAAKPTVVVHAAAFTDVDGAERDPEQAMSVNGAGTANVADAAKAAGAYLLAVGTDFVFAGDGGAPYAEDAEPTPVSAYGRSKLAGERATLAADAAFAVARTAWVFGGAGKHFPRTVLRTLRERGEMEVVADEAGSPTYAGDLAEALVELVAARGAGIFHLTNAGRTTRYELARSVAAAAGLDPAAVRPTTTEAFLRRFPLPARRPSDSTLLNRRAADLGIALRPWESAVHTYGPRLASELGFGGETGDKTVGVQNEAPF